MRAEYITVFSCQQSILYIKLRPKDWIRRINEILITNSKHQDPHHLYAPYLILPNGIGEILLMYNSNKTEYTTEIVFKHQVVKYITRLISKEMNLECVFKPSKLKPEYRVNEIADGIILDGIKLTDFSEKWAKNIVMEPEWSKMK